MCRASTVRATPGSLPLFAACVGVLLLLCSSGPTAAALRASGSVSFSLKSDFGASTLVADADAPLLLDKYYVVLVDKFGLEASVGSAQINASSVSVDWNALDDLLPRQLLLLSPSMVSTLERSSPTWLSSVAGTSSSESTTSNKKTVGDISSNVAAQVALLNRTFVFLRVFRSVTWAAVIATGINKPCGVPFIASTRLRFDMSSTGQWMTHQATLLATLDTADYVTVVAMQCSHVPLTLSFDYALLNDGGVEVTSSQIPYVNLHIFQLGIYAGALLLWVSHMLYTWHDSCHQPTVLPQTPSSVLPPLRTHQAWVMGCSRPDWLVAMLLSVKSIENIVEVGSRTIQFREVVPGDDGDSTRLDDAASVLHVAGNALVLISMMCVGSGWVFARVSIDYRRFMSQMGTFVVIYLAFAIFGISKYRNSFGGSIDFIVAIIYFVGVLLSVVQLRTCIEDLRMHVSGHPAASAGAAATTATVSHEPEDTIFFMRMHCLRVPFGLNVALMVVAWLLQAFVLTAEEDDYLSDAVSEFQSIVWAVMAIIFVRRDPVIY